MNITLDASFLDAIAYANHQSVKSLEQANLATAIGHCIKALRKKRYSVTQNHYLALSVGDGLLTVGVYKPNHKVDIRLSTQQTTRDQVLDREIPTAYAVNMPYSGPEVSGSIDGAFIKLLAALEADPHSFKQQTRLVFASPHYADREFLTLTAANWEYQLALKISVFCIIKNDAIEAPSPVNILSNGTASSAKIDLTDRENTSEENTMQVKKFAKSKAKTKTDEAVISVAVDVTAAETELETDRENTSEENTMQVKKFAKSKAKTKTDEAVISVAVDVTAAETELEVEIIDVAAAETELEDGQIEGEPGELDRVKAELEASLNQPITVKAEPVTEPAITTEPVADPYAALLNQWKAAKVAKVVAQLPQPKTPRPNYGKSGKSLDKTEVWPAEKIRTVKKLSQMGLILDRMFQDGLITLEIGMSLGLTKQQFSQAIGSISEAGYGINKNGNAYSVILPEGLEAPKLK